MSASNYPDGLKMGAAGSPWEPWPPDGAACGDCEACDEAPDRASAWGWCSEMGDWVRLDEDCGCESWRGDRADAASRLDGLREAWEEGKGDDVPW